jgi:hypothetical protein
MVYVMQDQDGNAVPSWSCSQTVRKPVWHIPLLCVQWRTAGDGRKNYPKHVELPAARYFLQKNSPSGDPNGGVVYLRIVLSPEEASRTYECFLTRRVLRRGVVSTSPNPQAGGPPLVGCPRLLIQFIRSYPPHRRLFFHPQPEDAPCHGDRDPLVTWTCRVSF